MQAPERFRGLFRCECVLFRRGGVAFIWCRKACLFDASKASLDSLGRRECVADLARGDREAHVRPAKPARCAATGHFAQRSLIEPLAPRERKKVLESTVVADASVDMHESCLRTLIHEHE